MLGGWWYALVWRRGFCGNDDRASEVGDIAVAVGSSSACSWDYLDLVVVVKSELWRRGPCGNDDSQQVVRSVVFHDASLA